MAALVCDLCGGKLVMGTGGIATCDSCGMEHSPERMREKVQEVKGVVQVDSSHLVENYMRMAQNAYDSGNKAEAENYCNKILETVPNHQQAWLLKGRAAGWQSTLGNIRFSEAINCFANAVANTEETEKTSVINECKQEVGELAEALIRPRGERFAKWPDEEEKKGFVADLTVILQAILQFFNSVGTLIDKDELMEPLATIINNSVLSAWKNVVRPTFANDHDGHPDDYELKRLIDRAGHCTDLLEKAIDLSESDVENDIQYYQNLIVIHEYLINAQSYSYETVSVGNSWVDGSTLYENQYVKSKSLTDEAKRQRRQLISTYERKIRDKKKVGFWSRNSSEHKFLVEELDKSKAERNKLLKTNTSHTKIERLKKHMSEIEAILAKDRELTARLEQSEKRFIENCKEFWDKLSSDDGAYDAYLDKNPILKRVPELARQRDQLLQKGRSIENSTSGEFAGPLVACAAGVLLTIVGFVVEIPLIWLLGGALAIGAGIASYSAIQDFTAASASKRDQEAKYAKEVLEYNAIIDKMLAVPKYDGHVDRDQEISIPAKITVSYSPKSTQPMNLPAFFITLIIGFIFGFAEVWSSSHGFGRAYKGMLSFIVGNEIWVSGIFAGVIWLGLVIAASFIAGKLFRTSK